MKDETNPLFLLYSIALAQFIVLLIAIVRKRSRNKKELVLLSLFVISLFIIVAEFLLMWSGYLKEISWILGISMPFHFVLAPIFLGLVYVERNKRIPWVFVFHFFPFIMLLQKYISSLFTSKLGFYVNEVMTEEAFRNANYIVVVMIWAIQLAGYLGYIKWSRKRSDFTLSMQSKIIFWVLSLVTILLFLHVGLLYFRLPFYALTYCVLVGLLGALGFQMQWGLLTGKDQGIGEKYQNSGLSPAIVDKEKLRISKKIQQDKPFLNPDLTLSTLAKHLELSPHHLSQIINQGFKMNFSEFVNEERIRFSLELLVRKDDDSTIEQISYESGFNSRNSFHRAFKKLMNMSPSQYRKQNTI